MSDIIDIDYRFDAAPEKVWRAISIADYRERWLPRADLAEPDPVAVIEGSAVSYKMRDSLPPHEESVVTFSISSDGNGGTRLAISQELLTPANANGETMMLAA